jgi:predicted phage tail protein
MGNSFMPAQKRVCASNAWTIPLTGAALSVIMFRGEIMKLFVLIVRNAFDPGKDREIRQLDIIPDAKIKNYLQTCLIPQTWQVYYASPRKMIGRVLNESEIDLIVPTGDDSLVVMAAIAGGDSDGDGKNVLNMVAQIGIMALSFYTGGAVAGLYGTTMAGATGAAAFWSYTAALAVQAVGGYLLGKMTPASSSSDSDSPSYSWGAISNATGEGNAIPLTFGTVRTGGQLLSAHITYDGEKQYLDLLYSGGEGPCDYGGDGENDNCTGIDNILINGNPIKNYQDVQIFKRAGLNNQSVIGNFNDTFVEKSINTELVADADWTTVTTESTAAQGLEIIIECPAGLYKANNSGGYDTASVSVQLEYKLHEPDGTDDDSKWINYNADKSPVTLSGTTPKAVRRKYRIDNLTQGQYDIRAKCTHKSGTSSSYATAVYLKTVSAVNYEDFSHPNLILLGIKALASDQLNGGMPTVTWEQTRSKGWVCNPHTALYEQKPLNIPAWAAYDLLSRIKNYGNISTGNLNIVVEGIAVGRMDYDAFKEAAEYQAEIVDGRQRCRCNYILDTTKTLWDALKDIEAVGRFKVIPRGTKYSCTVDRPATPVWMANDANTVLGSFSESYTSVDKRANSVEIRFRDQNNNYDWNTAVIPGDDYDKFETVPNPIQTTLNACTDWDSAWAEGAFLLRQNQKVIRTVSHSHSVDAIGVQIGDVYLLQSSVTDWAIGGRIVSATSKTIIIDQEVYLESKKTYQIAIRLADDSLITKTVQGFISNGMQVMMADMDENSGVYSNALILETEFTGIPEADNLYSFGNTTVAAKPFRVISITRDGDLQRKITGIEYVESIYDELVNIPIPVYTKNTETIQTTANSHVDTSGNPWLTLSWTTPRYYHGARIELNGKRVAKVDNTEDSIAIRLDSFGKYQIKITATDLFGVDIASASFEYEVRINDALPADVTGLSVLEDTFILRDGTVITDVNVSFSRPETFYKAFNVYYSSDGLQWTLAGQTSSGFYKLKSIKNTGKISVKVCTVSPFGIEAGGISVTVKLVGKSQPPDNVDSFVVVQDEYNRARIILAWGPVDDIQNPDLKGYEVRVGDNWETALKIGGLVYGLQTDYQVSASGNYTFMVKALDNSGNYSTKAVSKSITIEVKPNAPGNGQAVQDVRDSTYLSLTWAGVADKDLTAYEIKQGDNWDKGVWIDSTRETTYRLKLRSSGTYNFMVRAKNVAGFFSSVLNVPITVTIEPPEVTGFTVVQNNSDSSRIRFSWDKPKQPDIAYYEIREGTAWDSGTVVAGHIAGLFYDAVIHDENLKTFWIKAVNAGGMYSQYPAKFISVFELNPSTPKNLTVSQDSNDRAVLMISWTGIADLDLNEYEVRQGPTWETGQTVIKTKELQATWMPPLSGDYKFMLEAKNNAGYYSDEISAHFYITLEPANVTGFMVIQNGTNLLLNWDKHPEPDVIGYEIREGSQFDNGSLIATGITGSNWETPMDTETTKQYNIKAINRAGRYSQNAAGALVTITNLPPKNVVYSYDEVALQTGTHQNTEFGYSMYTFATFGGKFSDYSTTRFSDVGGLKVLKLEPKIVTTNLYNQSYLSNIHSWPNIITAQITADGYYRVDTAGDIGEFVCSKTIDILPNTKYTQSFLYRHDGQNPTIQITFFTSETGHHKISSTTTKDLGDGVKLASATWTSGANDKTLRCIDFNMVPTVGMTYIEVRDAQIQTGEYTPYTESSRVDEYYPSGSYLCERKDLGSVITANIGSQFVSSVLLSSGVSTILQYRISRYGTTWTDWIDFMPVQATFRYIDFRVILTTSDKSKTPEVNILTETIDVPDVDKYGTATVAAGGTDVSFGFTYWQAPVVTPTAIGQGMRAELVNVEKDRFRARVLNSSCSDVGGKINWLARGF